MTPSKPRAITCDIDSTLADTLHRAHLINVADRETTDWLAYAQACGGDTPTAVVGLLRVLAPHHKIILVTSRPEGARRQTQDWLAAAEVPYDSLVMLEKHGQDPTQYKVEAIEKIRRDYDVVLHLDDWWAVGEAVQTQLGIPTVIVRVYQPEALQPAF